LVAVAGSERALTVLDRRRIELAPSAGTEALQPYHAAEGLPLAEAERLVKRCEDDAARLGRQALQRAVDDLRAAGRDVVGCAVLLGSARPKTTLAATLRSHALIHAAEGELFRDALVRAGELCRLPVTGVRERDLAPWAAARLDRSSEDLQRYLNELGRPLGPPWRQDQKTAALAAWLALIAVPA